MLKKYEIGKVLPEWTSITEPVIGINPHETYTTIPNKYKPANDDRNSVTKEKIKM